MLTARFESARLLAALIVVSSGIARALLLYALGRSIFRRWEIASAGRTTGSWRASAATPSTATAKAAATSVSATIPASVSALITTPKVLAATIIARRTNAIGARWIFLCGIVMMAKILRSRSVRFRLALFGLGMYIGVRGIRVVMFFDNGLFFVIVDLLRVIDVLMLVMLVFAVRVVKGLGLGEFEMSRVFAGFGAVAERFARQHFGVHGYGNLRRGCMRLGMPMSVIVIF